MRLLHYSLISHIMDHDCGFALPVAEIVVSSYIVTKLAVVGFIGSGSTVFQGTIVIPGTLAPLARRMIFSNGLIASSIFLRVSRLFISQKLKCQ